MIHYNYSARQLESEAEKLLFRFDPERLKKPKSIDVYAVIEKCLGVEYDWKYITPDQSILGATAFNAGYIWVWPEPCYREGMLPSKVYLPKGCMQPISGGVRTTQKTHCPQRVSQTSSARTQNATIWSRSAIFTSAAESGAGGIWAFMSCSRLWSCNETSKPSVRAFMRSGSGTACGTKERTNAKNQSLFLYCSAQRAL